MIRRPGTWSGPEKLAIGFADRQVIDAGLAPSHQAAFVEFPQFVAVAAVPVTGNAAPFILETDGDAIVAKGPQPLHEPVVELSIPLAEQKCPYLIPAGDKFTPVSPYR